MHGQTLLYGIAATAAVLGGLGAKLWDLVLDSVRGRRQENATVTTAKIADEAKIRDELWGELNKLRERIDLLQGELDKTRSAYIELLGQHTELSARHNLLERDHEQLRIRYDKLKGDLAEIGSS